jgi:hypothetical protein
LNSGAVGTAVGTEIFLTAFLDFPSHSKFTKIARIQGCWHRGGDRNFFYGFTDHKSFTRLAVIILIYKLYFVFSKFVSRLLFRRVL